MIDYRTIYESARSAWTWGNDTPNGNEAFYRDYAAARAVWSAWAQANDVDMPEPDSLIHHSCMNQHHGAGFDRFAIQAKWFVDRFTSPARKPEKRMGWNDSEPFLSEGAAREFFESEFRRAFPGKRINSAFAKEKWAEYEGQARLIVEKRFAEQHEAWKARESARRMEHAKALRAWLNARRVNRVIAAFVADMHKLVSSRVAA